MANVGLFKEKNIPLNVNSFATDDLVYINTFKDNKNINISIPVIGEDEGVVNKIFPISLIYSHLCRNEDGHCGKGIRLDFMKFLDTANPNSYYLTWFILKNSDYTTNDYKEEDNRVCDSNNTYFIIQYNQKKKKNEYILYNEIGTQYVFDLINNYDFKLTKIVKANKDEISVTYENNDLLLTFVDNLSDNVTNKYQIKFYNYSSKKIDKIEYLFNDIPLSTVNLEYELDILKSVTKLVNSENIVFKKEYNFTSDSYIQIKNNITGKYTNYYIELDSIKYVNCFEENEESGKKTEITYYNKYTELKNYKNDIVKYIFNSKGKIISITDKYKKVKCFKYDETNRIVNETTFLDISKEESINNNNLITDGFFDNNSLLYECHKDMDCSIVNIFDGYYQKGLMVKNNGTESNPLTIIQEGLDIKKDTGMTFICALTKTISNNEEALITINLMNTKNNNKLPFGYLDEIFIDSINTVPDTLGKDIILSTLMKAPFELDKVAITINVPPGEEYIIKTVQLYNKLYGTITEYNEHGVISKIYNEQETRKYSYLKDDNVLLNTGKINDLNASIVNYNEKLKPVEVLYSNGIIIKNEYDNLGNLVKKTVNDNNYKVFNTEYEYSLDKTKLTKIKDGNKVYKEYQYNNRLLNKDITYLDNNKKIEDSYTYYNDLLLESHKATNNLTDSIEHRFIYDNKKRLEQIKISNTNSYKFHYDGFGNITKTCIKNLSNGDEIGLEEDSYEIKNNVYTENISNHKIGSSNECSNIYSYTYDDNDNIKEVFLVNEDAEKKLFEFIYDSYNKLIKVIDERSNNDNKDSISFEYGKEDELLKVINKTNNSLTTTEYKYDSKGNLIGKRIFKDNNEIESYSYVNGERKYNSPVKVRNYYKNYNNDLYTCFFLNKKNDGKFRVNLTNNENEIKLINDDNVDESNQVVDINGHSLSNSLVLPKAYKIDDDNNNLFLKYEFTNKKDEDENFISNGKTIGCWFKRLTNTKSQNIISLYSNNISNNNLIFNISVKEFTKTEDSIEIPYHKVMISTKNWSTNLYDEINNLDWNFIAVTYQINENSIYFTLNLNGVISSYNVDTSLTQGEKDLLMYGYIPENETNGTLLFTNLLFSSFILNNTEVDEFYKYTHDNYIIYESLLGEDNFNRRFITSRYDNLNNNILIPLQSDFKALNSDINYKFEKSNSVNERMEDLFVYNNKFNDYVFKTNGNKLIYDVSYVNKIMTGVKALSNNFNKKQILFELGSLANVNKKGVSLYINENGEVKIHVHYDNIGELNTGIIVEANKVYKYYITLELYDQFDSIYAYNMKVKVNDVTKTKYFETYSEIVIDKLTLCSSLTDQIYFDGLANTLVISNDNINLDTVIDLDNKEKYVKTVNNFGQLYKEELYKKSEKLLHKNIKYVEELENGYTKCYNKLYKEEYYTKSLATPIRKVTYNCDRIGNVTERCLESPSLTLENVVYEYDNYNRLIKETNLNIVKTYEYDKYSNITKVSEKDKNTLEIIKETEFVYEESWPHKLNYIYVNGERISFAYDSILKGMPVRIYKNDGSINNQLEWFNTLLIKYTIGTEGNVNYKYDINGLRVEKEFVNNIALGNIVHNYRYSDGQLIEEHVNDHIKGEEYTLRYMYDESGLLYGFKYDNTEYYYLRDSLQTIIGILDKNKNIVCEYIYDAYGNHKVLNENRVEVTGRYFIGNINPFRYKGYYYDKETQLFYCNSRYYSPELCRWISPDSIEYLDPSSINGLNLYCYCYNNPIMYVDDMGNLPVPVDVITSIIEYSADLYSFGLKMSLKSMPELSMAVAKKMARKAGHIQSARSYIRARHSNIVKTQNLSKGAKNFSKHFGRAVLVADILWSVGENYVSGDPNWVSDSVVDVGMSVGIYALGCIPYVGWALAIGATILTEVFDDEIEEFKDWFAEGWNDFWSFSWAN